MIVGYFPFNRIARGGGRRELEDDCLRLKSVGLYIDFVLSKPSINFLSLVTTGMLVAAEMPASASSVCTFL